MRTVVSQTLAQCILSIQFLQFYLEDGTHDRWKQRLRMCVSILKTWRSLLVKKVTLKMKFPRLLYHGESYLKCYFYYWRKRLGKNLPYMAQNHEKDPTKIACDRNSQSCPLSKHLPFHWHSIATTIQTC